MLRFQCFVLFFSLLAINFAIAQSNENYVSSLVPLQLTSNVNSVVRHDKKVITIEAFDRMTVYTKRIVTIYNKYGIKHHNAVEFYDEKTKIKELEARVYNSKGEEIKKIKAKDFLDESAVGGGTMYSDTRVKYLDYVPTSYPFTIEYVSEVEFKKTAFIPHWRPLDDYYLSVQYSEYHLINNSGVELKTKNQNFEGYNVEIVSPTHVIAKNMQAIKPEEYSPNILAITPLLKTALTRFDMEGVEGVNTNWKDFGKWMYDKLLKGTDQLPQTVIDEVKSLTTGVEDKIERAKIIYQYVQDKTRYVSVQIGIGGWKPMFAEEVDQLGYGDCKGLTNYTKALLESVDVESYYTVLYGDDDIKSMDSKFSATEGNHAILCIPNGEEQIFLECTSQTNPFGYIAGFTDDRDVLLVTPEGGKIIHSTVYTAEQSQQKTVAKVVLNESGDFTADVMIESTGYQYGLHQGIESKPLRDQKVYYKNYWDNINGLDIESISQINNRGDIIFREELALSAKNYASKSGVRLIFQPNMFNKMTSLPARYDLRQHDFKIQRGYMDIDEFTIQLPEKAEIEAMSEIENIDTKFGSCSFKIQEMDGNKIKYTRTYMLRKGDYSKDDYKEFRDFLKRVIKADQSKIVFILK